MSELIILVLEDEPEVRDALARDVEEFSPPFVIEVAEDSADAETVIQEVRRTVAKRRGED